MQFQACAYCDHPNPVGTNYCNDCGAALHLKPCRLCGAVAVAKAGHCPACKAEFPARPTINVDIPWAVPNAGRGSGRPDPRAPLSPLLGDADAVFDSASNQALETTKRLIEKASTRQVAQNSVRELVLPPPTKAPPRRDRATNSSRLPERPPLVSAVVAEAMHAAPPEELAAAGSMRNTAGTYRDAGSRRLGPVVLVSLSGLLAGAAAIYYLGYADGDWAGSAREIASPHKVLVPAVLVPAGPPLPAPKSEQAEERVGEASALSNIATEAAASPVSAATAGSAPLGIAAPAPAPALPMPVNQAAIAPPEDPPVPAKILPNATSGSDAPSLQAPVSAFPTAPSTTRGECAPELRALNLCGG